MEKVVYLHVFGESKDVTPLDTAQGMPPQIVEVYIYNIRVSGFPIKGGMSIPHIATAGDSSWRVTPVSKGVVTAIHKPRMAIWKGNNPT